MPGPAFMRTVFDLTKGDVGVAMNEPQTIAYVIRVIDFEPSLDTLLGRFKHETFRSYETVSLEDQLEMMRAWRKEFRANAGLKWEPRPQKPSNQPAQPEEPDSDSEPNL